MPSTTPTVIGPIRNTTLVCPAASHGTVQPATSPCDIHLVPTALALAAILSPAPMTSTGGPNPASGNSTPRPLPTGPPPAPPLLTRLVLLANITIAPGTWPSNGVTIQNNWTITAPPGRLTQLSFGGLLNLFNIDASGDLQFQGLVLSDLAVGEDSSFPYSMATWALWAIQPDR